MIKNPYAGNADCDCLGKFRQCNTGCVGFENCVKCSEFFDACSTSCKKKRDFASSMKTGYETVKEDDEQTEFSLKKAAEGKQKRKWKMPSWEVQHKA